MKIMRYHNSPPFNPTTTYPTLRDEMDRLFDVAFPALSTLQRGFANVFEGEFPVDLHQGKDAFVVRAELPGFRKEDLNVEVADNVLTVTAQRKAETKTDAKDGVTVEERRVSRSVSLPEHLQLDKIEAAYENGILTVKLPKSEAIKPKQIEIK